MNTNVSPPVAPPAPPPPPAPNAEWETLKTTLAGGNADRAKLLEGVGGVDQLFEKVGAQPQTFSWEDAKKLLAGEDPAAQALLGKYTDPQQATKAWLSLQGKLSEGGRVKIPGEGATPEELSEYAKAIGLPESVDKYEITAKPADGYEVTDGDKTAVASITKDLHELVAKGAKPAELINFATQRYYDMAAQAIVDSEERAAQAAVEGEEENRKLWGDKYDTNIGFAIAGAKKFFPGTDQEFDALMGAKLDTGHALFDHPLIQRIFAQVGMEHAEDPFFLAAKNKNTGFDPAKRIDEIKAMRNGTSEQRKQYAELSKPGGELAKLIEGLEKQKNRSAA